MSPFEIFRRNLRPLMIFLTLLALFAFVVLPAMQSYLTRQAGVGSDPVVANVNGKNINASRVTYFTRNHQSTVRFLRELAKVTIARGGVPRTPGFSFDSQTNEIRSVGIDERPSELATLRTFQFAAEANKAGFELDDTAIKNWLSQFTGGKLSDGEIMGILMEQTRNSMGQFQLYDQLEQHLLAEIYQRGATAGVVNGNMPITTPIEQWTNFLKINQKASVDAYGVLVSDYMDKTNDSPSGAEIQAVFEDGIKRYPNPQSPLPGFRKRESIKVEYLAADLNKYIKEEKAKFTEEELRAEYEKRLAGGDFQLPKEDPPAGSETAVDEAAKDTEEPAADDSEKATDDSAAKDRNAGKTDEPAESENAVATGDKPEMKKAEPSKEAKEQPKSDSETEQSTETAAPAAADQSPKSVEQMDELKDAIDQVNEEFKTDAADESDQSNANTATAVRLVALQDEQDEEKEAEAATEDTAVTDIPAEADEKTDDTEKAGEDSAPESDEDKKDEKGSDANEVSEAATDGTDENAAGEEEAEPATKPFEEVRDDIAESMAEHPAKKRLEKVVAEANKIMKDYFMDSTIYSGEKKGDPPARPDLKDVAKTLGMEYQSFGPLDIVSIANEPIAQSSELGTRFQRGPDFTTMMFGNPQMGIPKQQLLFPLQTVDDVKKTTYVSWKTEEVEGSIPTLDEVRDEVIMAIRRAEALKLATEAAEAIAAKADKGTPLADLVPEDKKKWYHEGVNPFSWMNSQGFQGATIGNVPELNSVGDKFMKAVFSGEVGKHSVGANLPEDTVYVVSVKSMQPNIEDLRDIFKQPQERIMGFALGSGQARKIMSGFYRTVDERTGFQYEAPEE